MFEFFDAFVGFITYIVNFVINIINMLILLVTQIPKALNFIQLSVTYLPPFLVVFIMLFVGVSIILQLLK